MKEINLSVDVKVWRRKYQDLVNRLDIPVIKALVETDDFYDSKKGYNHYKALQKNEASIERTAKAVETLEKYLAAKSVAKIKKSYIKKIVQK